MKRTLLTLVSLLTLSVSSYAGDWGLDISYNSGGWGARHRWVAPHRPVVVHRDYRPVVRGEVHYRYVRPVEPRGHWEWVETKEWVPGYNEKVWVPAEYEEMWVHAGRDSHGDEIPAHYVKVLVSEGHYESVWHEGYYQTVQKRVWVE
jgi:hypothetical protein